MIRLKLAYFGTPDFSADFLERLITNTSINQLIEVALVVTQPDRQAGRKQILTPSPVKVIAQKYSLKCLEIENLKLKIKNFDLALIYFYGQIIPKDILLLPKYGFWNIHFSALPKYRGPAPVVYSLMLGDKKTAVSFVQTDEKIDHGLIIAQQSVDILSTETKPELEQRLHNLAFEMFKYLIAGPGGKFLPASARNQRQAGKIAARCREPFLFHHPHSTLQNHSQATYTRFPTKDDGFIPLEVLKRAITGENIINFIPQIIKDYCQKNHLTIQPSNYLTIYNLYRGLYPWPGIWTLLPNDKRLKITNLTMQQFNNLTINSVQLEGKKEVDFTTFNQAYKIF